MLRIGSRTCVLDLDGDLDAAVGRFEDESNAFYARNATAGDAPMLDPAPRVALVRGLGCVAAAPDARTARGCGSSSPRTRTRRRGRRSTRSAAPAGSTSATCSTFEYWPLELYKLTLAPPPPELAGTSRS